MLTPRTAAWKVLHRVEKRTAEERALEERALLADLRRHAPELDEAVALAVRSRANQPAQSPQAAMYGRAKLDLLERRVLLVA